VQIIPVNDEVLPFADKLAAELREKLFRAQVDTAQESFNKKIRNAITSKIPNLWIIGNKEAENGNITWRRYAEKDNKAQETLSVAEALARLETLRTDRVMDNA